MRTITLTEAQKSTLMKEIAALFTEPGAFDFDIDVSDTLTINVRGSVDCGGYTEDDTDAYVETYRDAGVELTAVLYDPDTNMSEVVLLDASVEREANELLNAA